MEIYESRQFHPLNDLFHLVANGPDTLDNDAEYLRLRLNQEHFRRVILNIFAGHGVDFLVYPTVRVIPPTRKTGVSQVQRPLVSHEYSDWIPIRVASTHCSRRLY